MRFAKLLFILTAAIAEALPQTPVSGTPVSGITGAFQAPTYAKEIAPLLAERCGMCHVPGGSAPFSLLTYEDARQHAAEIATATRARYMPPWKADPHYGKWSNDASLTEAEIATIRKWADGGRPEGNPNDLPAAPHFEDGWKIGKPVRLADVLKSL